MQDLGEEYIGYSYVDDYGNEEIRLVSGGNITLVAGDGGLHGVDVGGLVGRVGS